MEMKGLIDQDGQVFEEREQEMMIQYFGEFLKEFDTVRRDVDIRLSEDDKAMLDSLLRLEELQEAAEALGKNQEPGRDGVPVEFYTIFWEQMGPLLLGAWNEVVSERQFDSKFFGIYISFRHKKGGKALKNKLSNKRGISMRLNSSYKIGAKALQRRLLKVLTNARTQEETALVPKDVDNRRSDDDKAMWYAPLCNFIDAITIERSFITLMHKKGDKALLKNKRGISILNVSYAIGAMVYQRRLEKVFRKRIALYWFKRVLRNARTHSVGDLPQLGQTVFR